MWTLLGTRESKAEVLVLESCLLQSLCVSTLHGQEEYSLELYICIINCDAGDGGMGETGRRRTGMEGRRRRGMEEGNSACWEIDVKKRHPVTTSLIPSQIGSGAAILTRICCLSSCRLRFSSGHLQYVIYMSKMVWDVR